MNSMFGGMMNLSLPEAYLARKVEMKKIIWLSLFLVLLPALSGAADLPSFKVAGHDGTSLSILVPQKTSSEQIKALIFEFRRARKANQLSGMIPPTTPGDEYGNYAVIIIFIFSEPRWASAAKLRDYWNPGTPYARTKTPKRDHKEYEKHIRGEYYYSIGSEEYGSLGYSDRVYQTKDFKRLF